MTDLLYPDCIRELYESEIFGEAWALALALIKVANKQFKIQNSEFKILKAIQNKGFGVSACAI